MRPNVERVKSAVVIKERKREKEREREREREKNWSEVGRAPNFSGKQIIGREAV
jgi:hypothetical protein